MEPMLETGSKCKLFWMSTHTECSCVCGGIFRAARRLVKRRLAAVLSTVCCLPPCWRFRTRLWLFGAPPGQLVHGFKLLMANYHPINLSECWAFVNSLCCKKTKRERSSPSFPQCTITPTPQGSRHQEETTANWRQELMLLFPECPFISCHFIL